MSSLPHAPRGQSNGLAAAGTARTAKARARFPNVASRRVDPDERDANRLRGGGTTSETTNPLRKGEMEKRLGTETSGGGLPFPLNLKGSVGSPSPHAPT